VTDTHTPKTQRRVAEYSATRDPGLAVGGVPGIEATQAATGAPIM
jgi:hypothetical protein